MAITATIPATVKRLLALGSVNMELLEVTAASGATSGTVTALTLSKVSHILMPAGFQHTSAPTFSGNVATIAFTVPTSTAASKAIQDITYTAVATNNTGNNITIAYTTGGTAGSEVVTVTGNAISIQIQSGTSTATQVKAAFDASAAATALATSAITGTAGTAQVAVTATALTGGITGGAVGTAILIGR